MHRLSLGSFRTVGVAELVVTVLPDLLLQDNFGISSAPPASRPAPDLPRLEPAFAAMLLSLPEQLTASGGMQEIAGPSWDADLYRRQIASLTAQELPYFR